jgi:beta-phosphoglucomutase-like phosphatase (HAD superfamily)
MNLPERLVDAIRREIEGYPLSEIAETARNVSNNYRGMKGFVSGEDEAKAYVAYRMPATFASLSVPALKNNDVMDFFDAIYQPEDVGKSKNHPDLFLYCAKELNTNPESCIVFEDIPSNIQGAKKANMLTCGVYDSYSLYYQEDLKKLSDIYITSYKELLA